MMSVDFSTREGITAEWDRWRKYIGNDGGGSWPRDAFESLLDYYDERVDILQRLVGQCQ